VKYSSDVAFSESVKTVQQARGSRAAYAKVERGGGFRTGVTAELREFLRTVDTGFLATASADGQPYVQHRGGPRGFLRGVDDTTIGFVDFAGNRQYVSTGNLAENDRVCLLAFDYATRRRVKIWGTARVVPATPALIAQLGDPSYRARPEQVMLITVDAWDLNCPQHIPQKLDAADVAHAIATLEARIAELEAKNRELEDLARRPSPR
jgi:predicted pyridoxine 5'-phosphate oxidase superfamily flavin-nucleotide-binding protein